MRWKVKDANLNLYPKHLNINHLASGSFRRRTPLERCGARQNQMETWWQTQNQPGKGAPGPSVERGGVLVPLNQRANGSCSIHNSANYQRGIKVAYLPRVDLFGSYCTRISDLLSKGIADSPKEFTPKTMQVDH